VVKTFEQWMDHERPHWRYWKPETESGSIARLMREAWNAAIKECDKELASRCEALNTVAKEYLAELEGLRQFKHSVDEALNSGDGAYRP
jgi:hypothetical protein